MAMAGKGSKPAASSAKEQIVKTKIDEELKDIMNKEDYEANKDCLFCIIVKARKI